MNDLVYHGPHTEPYYVTDSAYGIARAAHAGYPGIDLNTRTCKSNRWPFSRRRIVVVHWAEWWKHGFKPKPGKTVPKKPIEQLTLAQVRDLISVDNKHVILTAEEAALLCRLHRIIPFFEMKPSLWRLADVLRLKTFCASRRIAFCLMTIQSYGATAFARDRWESKAFKRMALATQAGAPALLLYRRPFDHEKWGPVLKGVKGHAGFAYSGGTVPGLVQFIRNLEKK